MILGHHHNFQHKYLEIVNDMWFAKSGILSPKDHVAHVSCAWSRL